MSTPDLYFESSVPTDEALAVQAAELADLRNRVAAAQAETGIADPALISEFAQAQRAFLDAKIRLEQMRFAGLLCEPATEAIAKEEIPEPVPVLLLPEDNPPKNAPQRRILKASTPFWITVIALLTALFCFQHSPYCYPR